MAKIVIDNLKVETDDDGDGMFIALDGYPPNWFSSAEIAQLRTFLNAN